MNINSYAERMEAYALAIEKYGLETQVIVAIEEMSEVIKALTKWLRCNTQAETEKVMPSIIEEVADAEIMLEQIQTFFGIRVDVREAMDAKIKRLKERMKKDA